MEHAVLRDRRRGLVPRFALPQEVRESFVLPGAHLEPVPPGKSKQEHVRYLDIYQDKPFDEAQFVDWVRQASELPGELL